MTVFVITMGVVYTLFTTTVGTTLASLVLKLSAGLRFRTTFKILGIHYFSVMIVPFVALSGLVYYVKHPTVAYEWVDWTASWTLIWMWTLGALAFSAWQFERKKELGLGKRGAVGTAVLQGLFPWAFLFAMWSPGPSWGGQDAESLRLGCDNGDARACNNLGFMYYAGDGVPQDFDRARSLYDQACNGGAMRGCSNLGLMYGTGQGVTEDLARALGLFQQACDGGAMLGCTRLGLMYDAGDGVTQDLARAASLYQQACDGEDVLGCYSLGLMYYAGDVVTQDLARAASLFRQACDGGLVQACSRE